MNSRKKSFLRIPLLSWWAEHRRVGEHRPKRGGTGNVNSQERERPGHRAQGTGFTGSSDRKAKKVLSSERPRVCLSLSCVKVFWGVETSSQPLKLCLTNRGRPS